MTVKIEKKLKTSDEWQKEFNRTIVLDPNGWDRTNWQYSWFEEEIDVSEYIKRVHNSTTIREIPKKKR